MPELKLSIRTITGKKVKVLRQGGNIPAVVYGHGIKPQSVSVDYLTFDKVYRQVGGSTLVDLLLDAVQPVKALIQEVTMHPVTGKYQHVDFHQVRMDEKISAAVPIVFIGEAKAVKELGGILVKNLNHLRIECLPKDLQHAIQVDLAPLEDFNKSIQVKDLKLPSVWQVLDSAEELVVGVEQPRAEEVVTATPVEDVSKVAGVADKLKEGEEAVKETGDKEVTAKEKKGKE